ncbi:hypothetical protein EDD16DRAFT_1217113 [Pisolithus croceorrhizus]|nr:hypothetical protein EDD16DRAFT_1217113 [Pisolithus croceorrhizus]KAI6135863.1 hypothetical protein EV401DRAFT_2203445 [Pisolithus croceorrhizus]KAI6169609.1 hypothetical protein EDD17DRAFT_1748755 [Pisolithus thermaeus]
MPPTRTSPAFVPAMCHICGKRLSRKADLPRHMRTHATNKEEFMFTCPYIGCEYKALQRSNLATHIHTHTGARPNKCPHPDCTYATSDPGSLTRHRRKAHGYDPKAKKTSSSVTKACQAPQKQERHSPYSISSLSSSDGSSPDELAWLEHQLSELDELLAEQSLPTLIPDLVAPAYDSALSTRAASYGNMPTVPCLVEDVFNPELPRSRGIKVPTAPYPSIFQDFEQGLSYTPSDTNISGLWAPPFFPGNNGTIFVDPVSNVCQQDLVSPFQPLQSTGVWADSHLLPVPSGFSHPPPSNLNGDFLLTGELGASAYPGFPSLNGFGAGGIDGFPHIYLQC